MTSDPTLSPETTSPSPPVTRSKFRAVYLLLLVACCATVAETLLKMGANDTKDQVHTAVSFGFSALPDRYTIIGIVFHIGAFAAWLYTLKSVPLSLAFNFTMLTQVTVSLSAWLVLREEMPWLRLGGIAFVVAGVLLLVPAIVNAEHRTEQGGES